MANNISRPRSLTARVLTIATLWAVIALFVVAVLISTLYRNGAERSFRQLLRAQLYNVINSISLGESGRLNGAPQLGDLRFTQPDSGWYWVVDIVDGGDAAPLASVSLSGQDIAIADVAQFPFNNRYERTYPSTDSNGRKVLVSETEVLLGDNGEVARFRVTGNQADIDTDVSAFSRQLFLFLALFGIGSLLVNAIAILFGLRPLDRIRRSLEDIRTGKTDELQGGFPREIAPLTGEVNALIDNNRRVVERARMQVGNLAHSLKTPIAVLLNESRSMAPDQARLVEEQASAMQNQVQHYLDRARIAAQQNSVLVRTDTKQTLQRLVRVMERLNPDTDFELLVPENVPALAMEQHDVEEILGNVLENAGKWTDGRVRIGTEATSDPSATDDPSESRNWLYVNVEDNGPGMPDNQLAEAMKRGRRLDETKPGTGLGLSIIKEIAEEYKGAVELDRSAMGGLRVRLRLPVAVR
jgi:signal transduction histidine kinase